MEKIKKIGLLTSGGDACGMNAVIRSIVRYAVYSGLEVVGFYEGYKGLIENNFKELNLNSVGGIIDRGGTFLYSARSEKFKTREGQRKAIDNLQKNKVDGLVVIGGDGTFRGAHDLHKQGIKVVGIPATIDNDIAGTDYSIGFDTALNVIIDIMSKIRDTASSHDRIFVVEVMGRNSGMIAVNSGVACGADYILIPEVKADIAKMANEIKNHREGKRHILIIVAEGAAKASDVAAGHIQRGGSPSALDRILSAKFGEKAVALLLDSKSDCMVAVKGMKVVAVDFEYIFNNRKEIDLDLYNLAHVLSL